MKSPSSETSPIPLHHDQKSIKCSRICTQATTVVSVSSKEQVTAHGLRLQYKTHTGRNLPVTSSLMILSVASESASASSATLPGFPDVRHPEVSAQIREDSDENCRSDQ